MVATRWEVSDRYKSQRTITYKHPLHVPMGPQNGLAEKTQTMNRYGDNGLCVISKTVTKGVPMADCFYIEDCLLVSSNGSSGISVSIMFELCFFTSTMFKKVISMTTINELLKFHNGFIKYIQQGLSNDAGINNISTEISDNKEESGMDIVHNTISNDPSMEYTTDELANRRDRLYFTKIFSATARKLSAVEPFVLGLVFAILLNQFFLLSKIKSLQGNLHILESLVESSRRNRMDSMYDEYGW